MDLKKVKTLIADNHAMTAKKAYEFGKDCAVNGANTTNCQISIFSAPEFTRAWERGKAENGE